MFIAIKSVDKRLAFNCVKYIESNKNRLRRFVYKIIGGTIVIDIFYIKSEKC